MSPWSKRLESSPALARAMPFLVFVALTVTQGWPGESSRYWIYLAKTFVGAWLIWLVRPFVVEMKWKFSREAVVVGVVVFVMWVGMDSLYPPLDRLLSYVRLAKTRSDAEQASELWNPNVQFGEGGAVAWMFIAVRILGSSLVVPPLEEIFYRSFLYRYVVKPDFQSVPLGQFAWVPFLVTSAVFGFAHHEWLAGILCGFAYQGLVCWKKRLGDAMTAHAITNFLLGIWVVWKGAWHFW
jgi:CAAX prenyl protease-like protein